MQDRLPRFFHADRSIKLEIASANCRAVFSPAIGSTLHLIAEGLATPEPAKAGKFGREPLSRPGDAAICGCAGHVNGAMSEASRRVRTEAFG